MKANEFVSLARAGLGMLHGRRDFGGPVMAMVGMTHACNLRCLHCLHYSPCLAHPTRANDTSLHLDRQPERMEGLLDDLLRLGTRNFELSPGGEPFMNPRILDYIARLKQARSYVTCHSNGTVLNESMLDELVSLGLDGLIITTMAGTEDTYARTHPGCPQGAFQAIERNLGYLAGRKRHGRARLPRVRLSFVVIRQNAEGIAAFAAFAARMGVDSVRYFPVFDVDDPGIAAVFPTAEQKPLIDAQLTAARPILDAAGINHNVERFRRVFRRRLDTAALYRVIGCYYLWYGIKIDPSGNVFPCCRCDVPIGNINERSFGEIWQGGDYRRLRAEARRLPRRMDTLPGYFCHSCIHYMQNIGFNRLFHPLTSRKAMAALRGGTS
jgi:MoaA/NifB/PqqE/SkfB family radical SAM enzyme